MPSSSHTVLSSRGTPSIVTCNRVLLRTPQGRKQARQPWSAEFPLHVACEGVVVRDLLLDLQELVVEAAALFLQALQRIEEMLLPEAPALRLLPGHLEGTGHVSAPWESGRRGTARAASAPRPSGRSGAGRIPGSSCGRRPVPSATSLAVARVAADGPELVFRAPATSSVLPRRAARRRGPWGRFTPDGPDYLIVMSALYSAFTCAVGRTVLSRSKRFIAWLTTSRAIPSVASSPKTSSRLSRSEERR